MTEKLPDTSLYLVAYLEATGHSIKETAAKAGKDEQWVRNKRYLNPHYAAILQQAKQEVLAAIRQAALAHVDKLNLEVGPSIDTILEVRDSREELGATRIKAAESILDRAPDGPKKVQQIGIEPKTIIQLPIKQLDTIRAAFEECSEGELLAGLEEIMEGEILEDGEGREQPRIVDEGGFRVVNVEEIK